jgi:hypothetical protein
MSLPSVDNLKSNKLVCFSPFVTSALTLKFASLTGAYLSGVHHSKCGSKL